MKINLPVTGPDVDFAPDANSFSTTDLASAITYANRDFIDVCGYSCDELLGWHQPALEPKAVYYHIWEFSYLINRRVVVKDQLVLVKTLWAFGP